MEVHKYLGKGHNEKVYGNALAMEFKLNNINTILNTKASIVKLFFPILPVMMKT